MAQLCIKEYILFLIFDPLLLITYKTIIALSVIIILFGFQLIFVMMLVLYVAYGTEFRVNGFEVEGEKEPLQEVAQMRRMGRRVG